MSAEAFLSSVVEIGIGMAGFAGIIAAIRQRDVSTWDPHHRVLLQMLFTATAAAIGFSLLPSILSEAGLLPSQTWRVGSVCLTLWFVGAIAFRRYQARQRGVRFPIARVVLVLVLPIVVLLVTNLQNGASWPYLLGVVGILINGFATFLALLFGESDPTQSTA